MRTTTRLIAAILMTAATGCAGTRNVKQINTPPPKEMPSPVLSRQERASRDMQLSPEELAKTQVEGHLVR